MIFIQILLNFDKLGYVSAIDASIMAFYLHKFSRAIARFLFQALVLTHPPVLCHLHFDSCLRHRHRLRIILEKRKNNKSLENVLCSSKKVSIFAADFAAHVLLTSMLMR